MIDWELADEVKMCTETAWRFAREKILPAMRDWETVRRIERAAHEAYAAIGLDAVDLPIEDGGAALGVLGKVAVLERLAVADPAAAIALDAHAVAYKAVADFANQAAIERILGPSTAKLRPDAGISVCVDLDQSLFRQANRITGLLPWVPGGGGARRLLIVGNGELLVLDAPFDHELVRGSGLVATSAASITLKEHAISERFASSDGCERFLAYLRLAYWDRGISIAMPGPGLGERPVLGMGTEEQKRRLLSPFLAPERPRWGAFAMTEPSGGSDVAAIRTRATKVDGGWVLNGAKAFSGNAERADWTVVWATVDPGQGRRGHRAFVIEKGTPGMEGFRTESKMGLRSYESISFFLNQCRVPDENLLGGADYYEKAAGFKGAMDTFNSGRPAVGAMAVGMGRAALDEALRLARASGAIALPRVADRLERMQRRLKSALLVALHAAWMADQRMPNVPQASMAKALGPAAALEAAQLAMEIAGPAAAAGGSVIEKIFRDIKAMDIVEGTGQVQRMVIARDLVQLPR
jgi:acyl-CoA dehydrogenase